MHTMKTREIYSRNQKFQAEDKFLRAAIPIQELQRQTHNLEFNSQANHQSCQQLLKQLNEEEVKEQRKRELQKQSKLELENKQRERLSGFNDKYKESTEKGPKNRNLKQILQHFSEEKNKSGRQARLDMIDTQREKNSQVSEIEQQQTKAIGSDMLKNNQKDQQIAYDQLTALEEGKTGSTSQKDELTYARATEKQSYQPENARQENLKEIETLSIMKLNRERERGMQLDMIEERKAKYARDDMEKKQLQRLAMCPDVIGNRQKQQQIAYDQLAALNKENELAYARPAGRQNRQLDGEAKTVTLKQVECLSRQKFNRAREQEDKLDKIQEEKAINAWDNMKKKHLKRLAMCPDVIENRQKQQQTVYDQLAALKNEKDFGNQGSNLSQVQLGPSARSLMLPSYIRYECNRK